MKDLADAAAQLMVPTDILAPIGCHFCRIDDTWEISLFVSSTQIVGGKCDGELRRSHFILDLPALMNLFSDIPAVAWQTQSHSDEDELGPHVAFEGVYAGNRVCLRILAEAPERFSVGRRAVVYTNKWEETW